MSPAMDDLLGEEILTFLPLSGTFDVETVAAAIAGLGFSYRDEIDPSSFAIFSEAEGRDALKAARCADPSTTFPYVLLVRVRPDAVLVFPVEDDAELRALSVQFLEWMMNHYQCRIMNEFGTDMSEPHPKVEDAGT